MLPHNLRKAEVTHLLEPSSQNTRGQADIRYIGSECRLVYESTA
jgi:hypothetical protein